MMIDSTEDNKIIKTEDDDKNERTDHKNNVITALLMLAIATTGTANSFASKIRADAYADHDFVVVV